MFSVIFEVRPAPEHWDAYLGVARSLRPELEAVDGFVDNIRYRSMTRAGWLLSLSSWRDEKAVVRWRTTMRHHIAQEKGRSEIFLDYHLRVGEVTRDTQIPAGHRLQQQRLDETEAGEGTTVTLVTGSGPENVGEEAGAAACAASLGLLPQADGLLSWDVFDAVLTPGNLILLMSWRDETAAKGFEDEASLAGQRLRHVRVIRDYGMFDRREAPQYYLDVPSRRSAG
ncbi:hypothetical protein FG93_05251 [Bosea sp. LC85]|uniref:antibiotic biosynthesis monooxygenase family protein n=1 Tax=Bosea sp. LC85 TaxID=1502851 RepID=UPI0004E3B3A4|nr:antibiotic biosynthesis monooxygenase [Bosea sp. LC85]KFC64655.1 hypothetical protein FG93_05251 [Bosea sp. LC85]